MNSHVEKKMGIMLQYLQMILGILVSFIYTPIMLRILGQSQYGIYNLASSIISYLSLLSLGFGASYIRFYSRYKKSDDNEGIRKLNGLFLSVFMVMGIVALISGFILSFNVSLFLNISYSSEELETTKILMIFMSINLALSFPNSVFVAYVTAQEKFVFQKLLNMVNTVLGPFLTLPLLLMGYGSIGMVVMVTVVSTLSGIINYYYCVSKLKMKFGFRGLDIKLLKEITVFSSFIAINQIVDQINWATDKLVLAKVCSGSVVAIYSIGAQINTYYLQFSTAISSVFVPQINRIVASDNMEREKNRQLSNIFSSVGRLQYMVLMLILSGFVFFGKFFIIKWAGENYENAYYVALLLIVPATIPLIQSIGIEIQRAKNMHRFRSYVYFGMALLNVVISIFLAKAFGEIGAALGTTISLIVANGVIMNIFYHKKIGIDISLFWSKILKLTPAFAAPACVGILLNLNHSEGIIIFIIKIVLYSIVYILSLYFMGMNSVEKGQINRILRKIIRRK